MLQKLELTTALRMIGETHYADVQRLLTWVRNDSNLNTVGQLVAMYEVRQAFRNKVTVAAARALAAEIREVLDEAMNVK